MKHLHPFDMRKDSCRQIRIILQSMYSRTAFCDHLQEYSPYEEWIEELVCFAENSIVRYMEDETRDPEEGRLWSEEVCRERWDEWGLIVDPRGAGE